MKKLALLILPFAFAACAHGDKSCCGGADKSAETTAAVAPAPAPKDADGLPTDAVNIHFSGMEASQIIMNMCEAQGVTCEKSKNLKKKVIPEIKAESVPWREALNQVVATAGYDYTVNNGVVTIKNGAAKKAPAKKK